LDVLTAENLRGEISELWEAGKFPAKSILLVTHNIEEAVTLSDRIVILGANPGSVRGELKVGMARPRNNKDPRFASLVDYIYTVMTNPTAVVGSGPGSPVKPAKPSRFPMLPHARTGGISGLCEFVADQGGREDLPKLAERLRLEIDDLLPTVDAAVMLGLAEVVDGDVILTPVGHEFAGAGVDRSHEMFGEQLLARVPFVATVVETVRQRKEGGVRKEFFIDILDEHFSEAEAERQFETLINWGRYAHLFEYDATEERLYLPDDN
jgi:NitT/TauT family transport system ATP-binding protein